MINLNWNTGYKIKLKLPQNIIGCGVTGVSAYMLKPNYQKLTWN